MVSVKNLWSILKENGPTGVSRYLAHRFSEKYHEYRLGVHTDDKVYLNDLGLQNPSYQNYTPVTYQSFRHVMNRVAIRSGEDVFLDLGCGMGRALILGATYPFRKVIGVEIAPKLSAIAAANVARARPKLKCQDVSIVTTDATQYQIPEDVSVIHANNPFRDSILGQVITNIRASLERRPRQLTVVFRNYDDFEKQLNGSSWLTQRQTFTMYPPCSYSIYDNRSS